MAKTLLIIARQVMHGIAERRNVICWEIEQRQNGPPIFDQVVHAFFVFLSVFLGEQLYRSFCL
jgi:hypothetical protein